VGLSGRDDVPLIVTCRSDQYESLGKSHDWIKNATRVRLSPVHGKQARAFITERASDLNRWRPVLDILDPPVSPSNEESAAPPLAAPAVTETLRGALSTPWRLTTAIYVYEQRDWSSPSQRPVYERDPADLLDPALNSEVVVRDHLLEPLVGAMVSAHDAGVWREGERAHLAAPRYPPEKVYTWLAVLAGYLHENAAGRTVANRPLSETNLILHELWPIAGGERARNLAAAFVALMTSPILIGLYLLSHQILIVIYGSAMVIGIVIICGLIPEWPEPVRFDTGMIRIRRRQLLSIFTAGLVVGLVMSLQLGLAVGLLSGAVYGLIAAAGMGLMVEGAEQAADPRAVLRSDATVWAVIALTLGLAFGLEAGPGAWVVIGLSAPFVYSLLCVILYVFALAFTEQVRRTLAEIRDAPGNIGNSAAETPLPRPAHRSPAMLVPVPGLASLRYLALLVCTRWGKAALPWRLGYFMSWCCEVGLLRVAGNGYQFRHIEMRDYLAQHPMPPAIRDSAFAATAPSRPGVF